MSELVDYYSSLYMSKQTYSIESLNDSCGKLARRQLNTPLTLEELQMATSLFPNSKAVEEDGLPIEV